MKCIVCHNANNYKHFVVSKVHSIAQFNLCFHAFILFYFDLSDLSHDSCHYDFQLDTHNAYVFNTKSSRIQCQVLTFPPRQAGGGH